MCTARRILIFVISLFLLCRAHALESEIHESILFELGRGCKSKVIRYDPKQLQLLENCRIIFGNLRISDMPQARSEDFKEFSFPSLIQVTGYLLVDNVNGLETFSRMFPNLTSIGGEKTFAGSSFVIRNNKSLKKIELKSLTQIGDGGVSITGNPNLCFVQTINWKLMMKPPNEAFLSNNKDVRECRSCMNSITNCWNLLKEQTRCDCWKCLADGEEKCCQFNCSDGPTVYFSQNSTSLFNLENRFQVDKKTCQRSGRITVGSDCVSKQSCFFNNQTLVYDESTDSCQPCGDRCPRRNCGSVKISSNNEIPDFRGCTTLTKLEIESTSESSLVDLNRRLKEFFSTIFEIKTCVIIRDSSGIHNLEFFHPRLSIRGSCEYNDDSYSLVLSGNDHLRSLFSDSSNVSIAGNSLIVKNQALCRENLEKFMRSTKSVVASPELQPECFDSETKIEVFPLATSIIFQVDQISDNFNLNCATAFLDFANSKFKVLNLLNGNCVNNLCELKNCEPNTTYACKGENTKKNSTEPIVISLPFITTLNEQTDLLKMTLRESEDDIDVTWSSEGLMKTSREDFFLLAAEMCSGNQNDFVRKFLSRQIFNPANKTDRLGFTHVYNQIGVEDSSSIIGGLKCDTCYEVSIHACTKANIVLCRKLASKEISTLKESDNFNLIVKVSFNAFLLVLLLILVLVRNFREKRKTRQEQGEPMIVIDSGKWEIERERIVQMYLIGRGNYGEVYKGYILPNDQEVVAIKTVKLEKSGDMSDEQFLEKKLDMETSFIDEVRRMTKLDAHHVIKLKGFWLRDKPLMALMEYMEHGDLKTFLLRHKMLSPSIQRSTNDYLQMPIVQRTCEELNSKIRPLTHMALEIADGMAYLERAKFVHRDLAARNCMVSSDFTIKIGDFGLTRFTDTMNYYRTRSSWDKPYRWMAPESLANEKFNSKSDVFSYGIVLWELATFGDRPYPNLREYEVVKKYVEDGRIMNKPPNCDDAIYELMKKCWKLDSAKRINFLQIISRLLDTLTEADAEFLTNFSQHSFYHKSILKPT